jgi:hypothetical protein
MKPYPREVLGLPERIFNYRLLRNGSGTQYMLQKIVSEIDEDE